MIGITKSNSPTPTLPRREGERMEGVFIQTTMECEGYTYQLRAMVRVLGLAMQAPECDAQDRELIVDYLHLMEDMLPSEGQLNLAQSPTSSLPNPLNGEQASGSI